MERERERESRKLHARVWCRQPTFNDEQNRQLGHSVNFQLGTFGFRFKFVGLFLILVC